MEFGLSSMFCWERRVAQRGLIKQWSGRATRLCRRQAKSVKAWRRTRHAWFWWRAWRPVGCLPRQAEVSSTVFCFVPFWSAGEPTETATWKRASHLVTSGQRFANVRQRRLWRSISVDRRQRPDPRVHDEVAAFDGIGQRSGGKRHHRGPAALGVSHGARWSSPPCPAPRGVRASYALLGWPPTMMAGWCMRAFAALRHRGNPRTAAARRQARGAAW